MTIRQRRYSKEEFARKGTEIYERDIRQKVEIDHLDEIVAIDIETGMWAVDPDEIAASRCVEALNPDAQVWIMRVGSPTVRRFGVHRR